MKHPHQQETEERQTGRQKDSETETERNKDEGSGKVSLLSFENALSKIKLHLTIGSKC